MNLTTYNRMHRIYRATSVAASDGLSAKGPVSHREIQRSQPPQSPSWNRILGKAVLRSHPAARRRILVLS